MTNLNIPKNFWLFLDKPYGMSSNAALSKVKRLLSLKKAGFSGTLDPLATGVLPIAFGEALKTMQYMTFSTKAYQFEVTFGEERSTGDFEGEVLNTSAVIPTKEDIQAVLPSFYGKIMQTPPVYSAIKIDGKRACDRVRDGEEVILKSREVEIFSLAILSFEESRATFEVECSAGTYVRSLAVDIAHKLNTVGYVSKLRRTRVGEFGESMLITLENLSTLVHNNTNLPLYPIGIGLDDILAVPIGREDYRNLLMGRPVATQEIATSDLVQLRLDGECVGFASLDNGLLKPKRMINI